MASVPSVVIDKIDAVVMAAADVVIKELTNNVAGESIKVFLNFAEGVAMLAAVQVPDAPTA